ncbi:hypothetical protein [Bordetella genomosp. 5]|uniref:hypothetical protein n=1 Tax=Bordetella genomosp. 5 TaxID=1395608 RepID=UPI001BAE5968|nr:hypothetical protein [Bordetella genomosp. 5]
MLFDLVPVHPDVLGFSNRWYPYAVETAGIMDLGNGIRIKPMSAVAFIATKLEAFVGRGGGDFMSSHDMEDVLNIIDGREELAGIERRTRRLAPSRGRDVRTTHRESRLRQHTARPSFRT